jgi:hypothetical protein
MLKRSSVLARCSVLFVLVGLPLEADCAPAPGPFSLAGRWVGPVDGAEGELRARAIAGGRFQVNFGISGQQGCSGQVDGIAARRETSFVMPKRTDDGRACRFTFTPVSSNRLAVDHNCSGFSGQSCDFSGELSRASVK